MKIYDPSEVDVLIGMVPISGFAEDEFISIAVDEDSFTTVTGVDGETTRSKAMNRNATVSVKLMQSSQANAYLSALHLLDLVTPGGAGIVPVLIKDKQGTSLFECATSFIVKFPDQPYAKAAGPREWSVKCVGALMFLGGN